MTMIVRQKKRIFFTIEGERGPFLMLHHGLFGSHLDWFEWGYVNVLASDFRLILPDARGHGRSDKPLLKDDYQLTHFTEDIIGILNDLGVRNIYFFGFFLNSF